MMNIITLCGNIGLKKEIEKVRKELLDSTDSIVINPTFDKMYLLNLENEKGNH